MTIFVVFRSLRPDLLGPAIAREFPRDHYQIADNEWLVSAEMTAKELSDKIGVTNGESGSAIVFAMQGYFGRAPTDIWEWIKAKAEGTGV